MVYGLWYKVPVTHYIEPGWYRRMDVVNPIPSAPTKERMSTRKLVKQNIS